jgi:hypothetical protein
MIAVVVSIMANTSTNSRAVGRGTMEKQYIFGTATAWGSEAAQVLDNV